MKRPLLIRPFRIPGNTAVACVIAVFPLFCTSLNVYFALTDTEDTESDDYVESELSLRLTLYIYVCRVS